MRTSDLSFKGRIEAVRRFLYCTCRRIRCGGKHDPDGRPCPLLCSGCRRFMQEHLFGRRLDHQLSFVQTQLGQLFPVLTMLSPIGVVATYGPEGLPVEILDRATVLPGRRLASRSMRQFVAAMIRPTATTASGSWLLRRRATTGSASPAGRDLIEGRPFSYPNYSPRIRL